MKTACSKSTSIVAYLVLCVILAITGTAMTVLWSSSSPPPRRPWGPHHGSGRVTGVHTDITKTLGTLPVRKDLRDLETSGPALDLYLICLRQIMDAEVTDPRSYFQIGSQACPACAAGLFVLLFADGNACLVNEVSNSRQHLSHLVWLRRAQITMDTRVTC